MLFEMMNMVNCFCECVIYSSKTTANQNIYVYSLIKHEWFSSLAQVPYKSHSQTTSNRQVITKCKGVDTGSAFSLSIFLLPQKDLCKSTCARPPAENLKKKKKQQQKQKVECYFPSRRRQTSQVTSDHR